MNLEQLFPKKSSFKLEATGQEHFLRPITLEDNVWIKHTFGQSIDKIFTLENLDFDAMTRIIYRLIVDKTPFKQIEIAEVDEKGNETTNKVGGIKLLQLMVKTNEIEDMIWAFNETLGISRPEPSKNSKEDSKKKS